MSQVFRPAVKYKSRLRMGIAGAAGSGKTYTSLLLATHIAKGEPVALIDTERGSASKYANEFKFDVLELGPPFHPMHFVSAIKAAEAAGYAVLIIDTLSHAWSGAGGVLEIVEEIGKRVRNSFAAWREATPIQMSLVDAMLRADMHVIGTMRSKTEYVLEDEERSGGRTVKVPRKVGMAPIQRSDMEYEFDIFMDMDAENNGLIQKTRCKPLTRRVFSPPDKELANIILEWLEGEEPPFGNTRLWWRAVEKLIKETTLDSEADVIEAAKAAGFVDGVNDATVQAMGKALKKEYGTLYEAAMSGEDESEIAKLLS